MTTSRIIRLAIFFLTMGFIFPHALQEGSEDKRTVVKDQVEAKRS